MEKIKHQNNKFMFWFFSVLYLIISIADIVLTYIGTSGTLDSSNEANFLVYTLGLGWNSLIITSIIFFVVIVMLLYYSFFRFQRIVIQCKGFKEFVSMLFFNRPDKFIWTLYKFPKNKIGFSYFASGIGFALIRVLLIGKLLAIILWIGVINDFNFVHLYHSSFNIQMTPLGRSDFLIAGIIFAISLFYYWFYQEYKINKKTDKINLLEVKIE